MRIALASLVLVAGCDGLHCDPEKLLAELAGPDATACGVLYLDGDLEPYAAYQCARAHPKFWVAIEPPSADGGETTGFASDGTQSFAVTYEYALSMGIGPDQESLEVWRCRTLASPRPCTTLDLDLCLACGDGERIKPACNNR